jgi:hypothetical protein
MRSPTASTFFTMRPRAKGGCGVCYVPSIVDAHHALCSPCAYHAPPPHFPGHGVRHVCTAINANHVSQACIQSPCALLVRITSPTILLRPRLTLRSHDSQRALCELSVHVVTKSPCARLVRIMPRTILPRRCACTHLVLALCASCPPIYYPSAGRGGRGVRYARTIINAHHVSQAYMLSPRLVRVHHVPQYTAQAAAYATLERFSTRII